MERQPPEHEPECGQDLCLRFGGPFPWHGSYDGVPAVMIPVEEYNRLLALSGRPTVPAAQAARVADAPLRLSWWDLDPEVAGFVAERLGTVPQTNILAQAVERFGADRAPTRSALGRYAARWKAARKRTPAPRPRRARGKCR